ncbi:MAG: NUDIX domain-containing protein [Desulfitobacteriia bacterium]|jgi:8-oxo-dGTP diphosphatase
MIFRVRAAAIILNSLREVLLVLHRNPLTGEEWWTLPGGRLENEESAMEAVIREIKEECGIECKPKSLVYVREFIEGHKEKVHHVELYFTAEVDNYDIETGLDPELDEQFIVESRFMSKEEIESTDISVYPEVLKDRFWYDLESGFVGHTVYLGIQK